MTAVLAAVSEKPALGSCSWPSRGAGRAWGTPHFRARRVAISSVTERQLLRFKPGKRLTCHRGWGSESGGMPSVLADVLGACRRASKGEPWWGRPMTSAGADADHSRPSLAGRGSERSDRKTSRQRSTRSWASTGRRSASTTRHDGVFDTCRYPMKTPTRRWTSCGAEGPAILINSTTSAHPPRSTYRAQSFPSKQGPCSYAHNTGLIEASGYRSRAERARNFPGRFVRASLNVGMRNHRRSIGRHSP